jgi:class 3 adenylate cyclase
MPSVRRLTAILAADVAGYSRLMGADEEVTYDSPLPSTYDLVSHRSAEERRHRHAAMNQVAGNHAC